MSRAALIAIDWGTSSFRAWRISDGGAVLDAVENTSGILAVTDGDFDAAFECALGPWLAADPGLAVIASGMITSRNGWWETPYLPLPLGAADLAAALTARQTASGRTVHFVTGAARDPSSGLPDVMRGEETELIGHIVASGQSNGLYVLPGTHSKWARVEGGVIVDFETFMTGELFALLCQHSILGRLIVSGEGSDAAFQQGVQVGSDHGASLLTTLFSARTLALFGRLQPADIADYLSGMLIGAEVAAGLARHPQPKAITIIGRGDLAQRYRMALLHNVVQVNLAQPGMACTGLIEIARRARLF